MGKEPISIRMAISILEIGLRIRRMGRGYWPMPAVLSMMVNGSTIKPPIKER